jgi:hypothetical protein
MDGAYPVIVLAPIVGLAADCLAQVGTARLRRIGNPYVSMAAGIVVGLAVSVAATTTANARSAFGPADRIGFQILNTATYLSLAFGYFNFVNLTIASLRIRLLGELNGAGGVLERAALLETYNTRQVIAVRIDRLVRGGHLRELDGRYFIGKRRFLAVARVYNFLRVLVIGPWPGDHSVRGG